MGGGQGLDDVSWVSFVLIILLLCFCCCSCCSFESIAVLLSGGFGQP